MTPTPNPVEAFLAEWECQALEAMQIAYDYSHTKLVRHAALRKLGASATTIFPKLVALVRAYKIWLPHSHGDMCDAWRNDKLPCDCGLDDSREELDRILA